MIKLYTDVHIHKAVVTQLRNRGIDIIHCEEVGMADAKDDEHLEYATSQRRSVVTNDADFKALHEEWSQSEKHHAGIFFITHDKDDIGMIVTTLAFWHEAIIGGAAVIENDVYNQLHYLP